MFLVCHGNIKPLKRRAEGRHGWKTISRCGGKWAGYEIYLWQQFYHKKLMKEAFRMQILIISPGAEGNHLK